MSPLLGPRRRTARTLLPASAAPARPTVPGYTRGVWGRGRAAGRAVRMPWRERGPGRRPGGPTETWHRLLHPTPPLPPAGWGAQVEGGFVQGLGWCCLEELVWGDAQHPWVPPGTLFTRGPGARRGAAAPTWGALARRLPDSSLQSISSFINLTLRQCVLAKFNFFK